MSSRSVLKHKGDVGLEAPEPKRTRRNTGAIADVAHRAAATAARKRAGGVPAAASRPKVTKRRKTDGASAADAGSLVGRRVGHSEANVKRAQAEPAKKASKGVGGGHTASRNTKLTANDEPYMLEDSATGTPSRKSTRKGSNRIKQATQLARREVRAVRAPKARAARSVARGAKVRAGSHKKSA